MHNYVYVDVECVCVSHLLWWIDDVVNQRKGRAPLCLNDSILLEWIDRNLKIACILLASSEKKSADMWKNEVGNQKTNDFLKQISNKCIITQISTLYIAYIGYFVYEIQIVFFTHTPRVQCKSTAWMKTNSHQTCQNCATNKKLHLSNCFSCFILHMLSIYVCVFRSLSGFICNRDFSLSSTSFVLLDNSVLLFLYSFYLWIVRSNFNRHITSIHFQIEAWIWLSQAVHIFPLLFFTFPCVALTLSFNFIFISIT